MNSKIPDIVLRLAQQQLVADHVAAPDLLEPGAPPLPIDDRAPAEANPDVAHVQTNSDVAPDDTMDEPGLSERQASFAGDALDGAASVSPITDAPDPPSPPLLRGGALDGEIRDPPHRILDRAAIRNESAFHGSALQKGPKRAAQIRNPQSEIINAFDPPDPPLLRGGEHGSQDGGASAHPLAATIDEQGRRLEEVLGDLERSLNSLFGAQLETLNHLRERAEEHERRWTEQTANRRAAFSPP